MTLLSVNNYNLLSSKVPKTYWFASFLCSVLVIQIIVVKI